MMAQIWIDVDLLRNALAGMPEGSTACLQVYEGGEFGYQGHEVPSLVLVSDDARRAALIAGVYKPYEAQMPAVWQDEESEEEA